MEDSKIIDLYWERNEKAISATEQKYGSYRMRMKVLMIHTSAHGTLYRRAVRIC